MSEYRKIVPQLGPQPHERHEGVWQNAQILFLQTNDQHYDGRPSSPEDFYQTVLSAQKLLHSLEKQGTSLLVQKNLTPFELSRVSRLREAIDSSSVQKRIISLIDAPDTDPSTLRSTIDTKHPDGAFELLIGDKETRINLDHLAKSIRQSDRMNLFSISDSHRTTADIFRALRKNEWSYRPRETAVLSFDHHTDTYKIPTNDPQKANVMRWLLEQKYIGKLGVIGTQTVDLADRMADATFVEGAFLYDGFGDPDKGKFEESLDRLFWGWSTTGIKEIYFSTDLDGLRLDKLGYTSTDYGIERRQWEALRRFARAEPYLFDQQLTSELRAKIWGSIHHALTSFTTMQRPYHGIPAAWILHAVRAAKDAPYDFHIGVSDIRTGKKVIGDITEVSGVDRKRHGERITTALVEALLKETSSAS